MTTETHVVASSGLNCVRQVVHHTTPAATVLGLADPLNVGPLWDLESEATARRDFWRQIDPHDAWADLHTADNSVISRLRSTAGPVTVWYGPHPLEYLVALRVAAVLRDSARPLFHVVRTKDPPTLPTFYAAISLATPSELAPFAATRRLVQNVSELATLWHNLMSTRSAFFRELLQTTVTELPVNAYDSRLLSFCTRDWRPTADVLAQTLLDTPVSDHVLAWRLRELVSSGALLSRGVGPYGHKEVALPTDSIPPDTHS